MSMDIDLKLFPKWLRTMLTTSILSMDKIQNLLQSHKDQQMFTWFREVKKKNFKVALFGAQ